MPMLLGGTFDLLIFDMALTLCVFEHACEDLANICCMGSFSKNRRNKTFEKMYTGQKQKFS